jgi:murein DD-endopeptidase MepM/ murein hydrolase activator NlpD
MGQAAAGQVGVFDMAVLSQSRVVSGVQTSSGKLKVIVWDLALTNSNTVQTITRRGDTGEVEPVSAIAMSGTSESNQVAGAVRNAAGHLKVFYWDTDAGGAIKETAQTEAGAASLVSITRFKKTTLLTAVRDGDNTLRLILWKLKDDNGKKTINRQGEAEAGVVGAISLGLIDTYHPTVASAVRDGAGNLKVVLWQISTHNGYNILHGDDVRGHEVVGYWHMSEINPQLLKAGTKVKAGQYLGRLGNSGASGGPHLHIHAVKVNVKVNGGPIDDLNSNDKNGAPTLTLEQLIEKVKDGTWSDAPFDVPYRPLVFHNARAMVASGLKKGGVWKNPFGVLNDDGIYFERYAVFPGPATELPECGNIDKKIAELNSEIDDLQNQIGEEVGQAKAAIANQIKALRKQIDELKAHGLGIGCKI